MIRRKIAVLSIFGVLTVGFIMSLLLPPHGFNNQSPLERDKLMATDAQLQRLSHLLVYIHEQNDKFPKNIRADASFYIHEVTEAVKMGRGLNYDAAHRNISKIPSFSIQCLSS